MFQKLLFFLKKKKYKRVSYYQAQKFCMQMFLLLDRCSSFVNTTNDLSQGFFIDV